jgi:hypothetical protein
MADAELALNGAQLDSVPTGTEHQRRTGEGVECRTRFGQRPDVGASEDTVDISDYDDAGRRRLRSERSGGREHVSQL